MMYYETQLPVRYYETDQMGVVHHSNYIRYFECARNGMMADAGIPIERLEAEDRVMTPIVSVSCRFKHPARMGDTLRCVAMVEKAPLAKLRVSQAVYNQDGQLCADGEVVIGFIDADSFRPVACPEKVRTMIEKRLNDR